MARRVLVVTPSLVLLSPSLALAGVHADAGAFVGQVIPFSGGSVT